MEKLGDGKEEGTAGWHWRSGHVTTEVKELLDEMVKRENLP